MHQRRYREPRRALVARTLSWISAADSWSAPTIDDTYESLCRHSTPLGLPVVPPVQYMMRSSGDPRSCAPDRPAPPHLPSVTAPGRSGASLPSSTAMSRVGSRGRQHVGELRTERAVVDDGARFDVVEQVGDLARRVVMVDVHRDGAGLEAADDHLRVVVVVHDQRDAVLAALPVVQPVALVVGAESLVGQEVRQPTGAAPPCRRRWSCGHRTPSSVRSGMTSAMASTTSPMVHSPMARRYAGGRSHRAGQGRCPA